MEEKQLNDKRMSEEVGTIIDETVKHLKKAARAFFDLMVEKTAQTADGIVDKKVDCLKKKIGKEDING